VEPEEVVFSNLCDAIVRYLTQHPDAADTVCGIANWWLPPERRDVDERMIQRALDGLVREGKVTRHLLVDGTFLYARDMTNNGDATH
jgi:hypothetical protein